MEAYKVWATLNLRGDAHKKMEMFLKLVNKTNAEVNKLLKSLDKFSSNMGTLSKIFGTTNSEVKIYNINIQQSTNIMNSATLSANRYAVALTRINNSVRGGGGGGRGRGGAGHGGFAHGAMMGIGMRHMAGMGAAAAGYAAGHTIFSAYHTGGEYQREMASLTAQNIPGLGQAQAERFIAGQQNPYVSRLENLTALVEAASITKNAKEALKLAPNVARLRYLAEGLGNPEAKFTHKQMQAAIKVPEIVSGSANADVLAQHQEMMFRTYLSSGMRVTPSDYLNVARTSRGYTKGMDPEFFYYGLEPLIQEFGKNVGHMIAQFYSHMQVGTLKKGGMVMLQQLGLLDPSKVHLTKAGEIKSIDVGAIKGISGKGRLNLGAWLQEILMPSLKSHGYTTTQKQEEAIGKIFTASDLTMVQAFFQQWDKLLEFQKINAATKGFKEMDEVFIGMHYGHVKQLTTSFSDFKLVLDGLTGPYLDNIADGLANLLKVLKGFLIFYKVGEQASNHDPIGALKAGVPTLIDWAYKAYSKVSDVTSPASNDAGMNIHTQINLDGETIARSVTKYIPRTLNPLVQHGTTAINSVSSPFSTALNYTGQVGQ